MTNSIRKVYTEAEKEDYLKHQSYATGIVNHEFSDEVIAACATAREEMNQRIFNGESTEEEEEEKLLKQWKELHSQ